MTSTQIHALPRKGCSSPCLLTAVCATSWPQDIIWYHLEVPSVERILTAAKITKVKIWGNLTWDLRLPLHKRNGLQDCFGGDHDHVWIYLLWSKSPSHSGSPGCWMREAQLVSGSQLGTLICAGRKLWPCLPGIQQASCGTTALPRQGVLGLHHGFQRIR